MLLLGVGLALLLAIGAAVLLTRDDAPPRASLPGDETSPSDGDVASPSSPAFRFEKVSRKLVRTAPGRVGEKRRQAGLRAAAEARAVLTVLYTEAFLDPANWMQGRYAEAFGRFTRGAREHAASRETLLTAGPRAGERYERIEPRSGRLVTRVLLDRRGAPTLLVSIVRFSALASGPEPVTFRSTGQYFFEQVGGTWKIVSFHVTRRDAPEEAA